MEEKERSLSSASNSQVVENWIFSLIPVGVAFAFYLVFILQSDIENKNSFIAYGATAGFIGLESYWIARGLRNKRNGVVVMGLIGIAITLAVLSLIA
jgi:hypothetical protein